MKLALKITLLACFLLTACYENTNDLPPQFKWESFQRFWSKNATPFVSLNGAYKVETGYQIDYGHGVLLNINIKDTIVTDVIVSFTQVAQNNQGGQQFLRMIDQIMDIGVFRWTGKEIATMRNFFGPMTNMKKEFSYKTSHFIREAKGNLWTFQLVFIANTKEMWSQESAIQ